MYMICWFESSILFSGNGSPEYFYEAQKIVYDKMEGSFYREFVLSHDYTEFVCASESAMDELRAHRSKEDDPVTLRDWNDGFGFKERVERFLFWFY